MKTPKSKLAVTPRTREQWRQWMLHDLAFATDMLIKAGQVTQMFVLHKPDGGKVIVRAPFTADAQRLGVLKFLAAACIAHEVVGFSCISESWLGIPAYPSASARPAARWSRSC